MEGIRETLHAFRVDFDTFFLEGSLHEGDPSPVDIAFDRLRKQGHLYESEGALWLRTTEFGDDKDRVLRRSTGAPTYFAADVAYQEDKFRRGFDKAIYVLGADHHGYVARLKAIASTLGEDPDRVEVPILQFVHIVEGGEKAKMSKRAGDFVRLSELIERIGVDASRWFMLSRSHDSTIDLDLDLAAKQDPENPVYYVQMMHARIAGIFRQLPEGRVDAALSADAAGVALNDAERELIRKVLAFPHEVREAVARRAPHRIASYALELGQSYAAFYRDSPVRDEPDEAVQSFRIALSVATRRTLAAALTLLGVSAPGADSPPHHRLPSARSCPRRTSTPTTVGSCCATGPSACSSRAHSCARARRRSGSSPRRAARPAARPSTSWAATRPGGDVVIYAGTQDQLLSVTVSEADFRSIREAITPR